MAATADHEEGDMLEELRLMVGRELKVRSKAAPVLGSACTIDARCIPLRALAGGDVQVAGAALQPARQCGQAVGGVQPLCCHCDTRNQTAAGIACEPRRLLRKFADQHGTNLRVTYLVCGTDKVSRDSTAVDLAPCNALVAGHASSHIPLPCCLRCCGFHRTRGPK